MKQQQSRNNKNPNHYNTCFKCGWVCKCVELRTWETFWDNGTRFCISHHQRGKLAVLTNNRCERRRRWRRRHHQTQIFRERRFMLEHVKERKTKQIT